MTAAGEILHARVHDPFLKEKRGDRLVVRAMPVASVDLGVRGVCDAVEFIRDESGITLYGQDGKWRPFPVEYKHGSGAAQEADSAQLCLQGICLEEMLCCRIDNGFIYHDALRRREAVAFSDELRKRVRDVVAEMHRLFEHAHTPKVRKRPGCGSCSLREICLPELGRSLPVHTYISRALGEKQEDGI